MPGVDRDSIEAAVENDVVTIQGRIDFTNYEGMQPVYTEYNVGHYARSRSEQNQRSYEGRRGHDRAAQSRAIQAAQNPGELAPPSRTETQG